MTQAKAFRLEVLLRQRHLWYPDAVLLARREELHQELSDLKTELGVTDERAFLDSQAAARGEIA
jgi:hypothetical protein